MRSLEKIKNKILKKQIVIIAFFIFISINSFAQNDLEYKRNTITPILLIDNNNQQIENAFNQSKVPEKFFCNITSNNVIHSGINSENDLKELLRNNRIPANSLNVWRTQQTILERTKYGLEKQEIDMLEKTNRKFDCKVADENWFKEFILNTYIVVFKINNVSEKDEEYKKGFFGSVDAYLFKINLDNSNYNLFINNWTNEIVQKDNYDYDIQFIVKTNVKCEGVKFKEETSKTQDDLYTRLVNNAISESLKEIGYNYEPFLLKNEVVASHPIISNIGKKESVLPNQLFFLYNLKNGKWKKTGTVRARKIADNRKVALGKVEPTIFYPVHWGSYGVNAEGSQLRPKKDIGLSLSFGYDTQPTQGFKFNLAQKVHKLLNTTDMLNFKIYFEANILNGLKDQNVFFVDNNLGNKNELFVYNLGLGLSNDFYILPGMQLTPFVGYYVENATYKNRADINQKISPNKIPVASLPIIGKFIDSSNDNYGQIAYLNFGFRLPINLTYNVKIVPSYAYSLRTYNNTKGVAFFANNSNYSKNIVVDKNNSFFDISLQLDF